MTTRRESRSSAGTRRPGQIRSWSFDSSGGHGTGLWSPTPEGWRIESTGMLADGTPTVVAGLPHSRSPGKTTSSAGGPSIARSGRAALPDTREVVLGPSAGETLTGRSSPAA